MADLEERLVEHLDAVATQGGKVSLPTQTRTKVVTSSNRVLPKRESDLTFLSPAEWESLRQRLEILWKEYENREMAEKAKNPVRDWRCKECGTIFKQAWKENEPIQCPSCAPVLTPCDPVVG